MRKVTPDITRGGHAAGPVELVALNPQDFPGREPATADQLDLDAAAGGHPIVAHAVDELEERRAPR